jgi:glycerol-3-phosphate dehydrogenase
VSQQSIHRMDPRPDGTPPCFDVVVVGGGINGAGVARDAAGRGLSVLLVEQDDLAAHTSSASTKLIHGGLRYLEYHEFSLVRKALQERERLLWSAPHIMWPMRFVMPHDPGMRSRWLIRAGLFLYDHLARRERLEGSYAVDLKKHPAGQALKADWPHGFEYSDGWVEDSRLVVLCARDAQDRGARILTRCQCQGAQRLDDAQGPRWRIQLAERFPGAKPGRVPGEVEARVLVNAAGPWVESVLGSVGMTQAARHIRHVKGSHVVVPAVFDHDYGYLFQNTDRRVIFALPYERRFTLIGTTDVDFVGDPAKVSIDADEINYLCSSVSRYLKRPVRPADVVWSYAGVRPLLDDASGQAAAVTRDYALDLNTNGAPILSIYGGKITTFRRLAEEAVDRLLPVLGRRLPPWTAQARLPGAALGNEAFEAWLAVMHKHYPYIDGVLLRRLARAYGTRMEPWLSAGLNPMLVPGLPLIELRHLVENEWAMTAEDVLWRRSKLGLHFDASQRQRLVEWFAERSVA